MKTISLSCEDAAFDLAATALCVAYGYQPTVPDPDHPGQTIANPVTPGEFARQQIVNFIKDVTRGYLANLKRAEAEVAARQLAQAQVDAIQVTTSIS